MKVKELIKSKFEAWEGEYDYDGRFSTMPIDDVYTSNEYYDEDRKEVVVLY